MFSGDATDKLFRITIPHCSFDTFWMSRPYKWKGPVGNGQMKTKA